MYERVFANLFIFLTNKETKNLERTGILLTENVSEQTQTPDDSLREEYEQGSLLLGDSRYVMTWVTG
jgi:hypothetical protein